MYLRLIDLCTWLAFKAHRLVYLRLIDLCTWLVFKALRLVHLRLIDLCKSEEEEEPLERALPVAAYWSESTLSS